MRQGSVRGHDVLRIGAEEAPDRLLVVRAKPGGAGRQGEYLKGVQQQHPAIEPVELGIDADLQHGPQVLVVQLVQGVDVAR